MGNPNTLTPTPPPGESFDRSDPTITDEAFKDFEESFNNPTGVEQEQKSDISESVSAAENRVGNVMDKIADQAPQLAPETSQSEVDSAAEIAKPASDEIEPFTSKKAKIKTALADRLDKIADFLDDSAERSQDKLDAKQALRKVGKGAINHAPHAVKSSESIKAITEKRKNGDESTALPNKAQERGGIWGALRSIKEAAAKRWRARKQRKATEHAQVAAKAEQDEAFASYESNVVYSSTDMMEQAKKMDKNYISKEELAATEESDNEILAEKAELRNWRKLENRRILEEAEQREIDKARPERKINARNAMIYARAARIAKIRRKQARREIQRKGINWTKTNTIRTGKALWRFTKATGRGIKGAAVGAVNGAITEARNPAGAHSANKN